MLPTTIMLALAAILMGGKMPVSTINLDGVLIEVRWNDGDSFLLMGGSHEGSRARVMGYNTLESYGPVHSWGDWSAEELYWQAKQASKYAASRTWHCTADSKRDHYGRLLIRCDDLIEFMVSEGHAHLFEIGRTPNPKHLAAQKAAIASKKGLWRKGVPEGLITSVHSLDERQQDASYNRIASPMTGMAQKFSHAHTYKTCEKVCLQGSCMIYVKFKQRYGDDRPACIRWHPTDAVIPKKKP